VQTCRGSHTHSVVSGPDEHAGEHGRIIVYNSGTSDVREEEELAGCIDDSPGDDRTALFRIDVIEIPVQRPAESRIVGRAGDGVTTRQRAGLAETLNGIAARLR
jgi:hypothetical protein